MAKQKLSVTLTLTEMAGVLWAHAQACYPEATIEFVHVESYDTPVMTVECAQGGIVEIHKTLRHRAGGAN